MSGDPATSAVPAVLCAILAAVAVHLALPLGTPRSRPRERPPRGVDGAGVDPAEPGGGPGHDALGRHRFVASALAAAAPVVVLGGVLGAVAAPVAGALAWRALGAREPAEERRRRERRTRQLPHAVDLLSVTLAAGASPAAALALVADAVEAPLSDDLRSAEHSLALGRDPAQVWRELGRRPGLAALGRTMVRAVESGASVSDALQRLAEDLHASVRSEAESRARSVGVRAAAPLGLCLLPAFVVTGVVPLVAGTVRSLLGG